MTSATITSKHQVTIPRKVRQQMNLRRGDRIEFSDSASGKVVLSKVADVKLSDGAAAKFIPGKKRLSVDEIKAAARAGALKSYTGKGG